MSTVPALESPMISARITQDVTTVQFEDGFYTQVNGDELLKIGDPHLTEAEANVNTVRTRLNIAISGNVDLPAGNAFFNNMIEKVSKRFQPHQWTTALRRVADARVYIFWAADDQARRALKVLGVITTELGHDDPELMQKIRDLVPSTVIAPSVNVMKSAKAIEAALPENVNIVVPTEQHKKLYTTFMEYDTGLILNADGSLTHFRFTN